MNTTNGIEIKSMQNDEDRSTKIIHQIKSTMEKVSGRKPIEGTNARKCLPCSFQKSFCKHFAMSKISMSAQNQIWAFHSNIWEANVLNVLIAFKSIVDASPPHHHKQTQFIKWNKRKNFNHIQNSGNASICYRHLHKLYHQLLITILILFAIFCVHKLLEIIESASTRMVVIPLDFPNTRNASWLLKLCTPLIILHKQERGIVLLPSTCGKLVRCRQFSVSCFNVKI